MGYAQHPRPHIMPYSNENEFQNLLKRHFDRGNNMGNFQLTQGVRTQKYQRKARATAISFQKEMTNETNKRFGNKLGKGTSFTTNFAKGNEAPNYLTARSNVTLKLQNKISSQEEKLEEMTPPGSQERAKTAGQSAGRRTLANKLMDSTQAQTTKNISKPKREDVSEDPEFCQSPKKLSCTTDIQDYLNKIRTKDSNIETYKGFSSSIGTRKLQSAFRNIKCLQQKIEGNESGSVIHGRELTQPSKGLIRRLQTQQGKRPPQRNNEIDTNELDLMVKSFTHSQSKDETQLMLSQTRFGSFQKMGKFEASMQSVANSTNFAKFGQSVDMSSMIQTGRGGFESSRYSNANESQTAGSLKSAKAQTKNLIGYNVKQKHFSNIRNFFKSREEPLKTAFEPQVILLEAEKPKIDTQSSIDVTKPQEKSQRNVLAGKRGSQDTQGSFTARAFVVPDVIDRVDSNYVDQMDAEVAMRSSWAQSYGIPAKTGTLVKHQFKMVNSSETDAMKEAPEQALRFSQKNRFHEVQFETPGTLWSKEAKQMQKSNPTAYAAQIHRDEVDRKMLEKKKEAKLNQQDYEMRMINKKIQNATKSKETPEKDLKESKASFEELDNKKSKKPVKEIKKGPASSGTPREPKGALKSPRTGEIKGVTVKV